MENICGANCNECKDKDSCGGCAKTNGRPFGKKCIVAECAIKSQFGTCHKCGNCILRKTIISEIRNLGIDELTKVKYLYSLKGSYINLKYRNKLGVGFKLLDDDMIYLGTQVEKKDSTRCYGICASEDFIIVSEYDFNGKNPKLIIYKDRQR